MYFSAHYYFQAMPDPYPHIKLILAPHVNVEISFISWYISSIGMVVSGWWLDLMILEVFSNLNDSTILWYDIV